MRAAGNWISAGATFEDFWRISWVMVPLLALTWLFDYRGSPNPERPQPSIMTFGFLPALLCIGTAAMWIVLKGTW